MNELKEKADEVIVLDDVGGVPEQLEEKENFGIDAGWAEEKNAGASFKICGVGISFLLREKVGVSLKIWRNKERSGKCRR